MTAFDNLLLLLRTGRLRRTFEPGPIAGHPSAQEADLAFVLNEHGRRKWGDVQSYGPGAAEAEARRAAKLGIEQTPDTGAISQKTKTKSRRLSKRERLERRAERLRADVAKLEKGRE
jgi:hypothetical protein